ncbi:trypsin-like peptidase domain-containing protein [Streptomyces althioticus]|uniref:trypsin-like peptidase domain-containing protein n=1 Tax=Streptomyces althioticus TaxID=83380 RepID=UPI003873057D|nr:trypsin-like peptidase domain-containing protein [Streptomyces althioticus]
MNEGKPGTPEASEGPDGDFELARPNGMRSPRTGPDGDYELGRPLSGAPGGGATADSPAWDRPSDSDTAPGRGTATGSGAESVADHPAGAADTTSGSEPGAAGTGIEHVADGAAGQPTASAPHAASPEAPASASGAAIPGQGAGTVPAPSADAPTAPAPAAEAAGPGVTGAVPAPAAEAAGPGVTGAVSAPAAEAAGPGVTGTVPAPAADASAPGATGSVSAPASHGAPPPAGEQPKPLHDPDPYSTPPYGEPGPWAPAPPVQHPAATPAHGVPMGAPPSAPEAAPRPGAPSVPAPPVQHPAATPAHGVPMGAPPSAPEAVPGAGAPSVPAPSVQHLAATPAHGVPMGAPPAAPEAASEPGGHATVPEPGPAAQDAPVAGPWARYDPWAAPTAVAPLQQADPVEEDVKRRRGRRRRALVGGALVIALVSGVAGGVVGVQLERNGGIGAVELPQAGVEAPDRDPDSVAGIAAQALPSVVTLHVSGGGKAGTGTGFVLDDRGHILTNDHVVEPAGKNGDITVTFHSGDTAEATVVGRDSGYDLAVVRVKGVRGLTPLPLGNSDNVQVGDPVVAIGAPFDLAGTVTSGIISARERPITAGGEDGDGSDVSYVDALQTDAPINPGNSGGPLLDGKGRVVGINSAIRSADGGLDPEGGQSGSIGLGFAIPINQGKRVAEELIEHGKAAHPVIGITLDMAYSGDGARVAAEGGDGGPPVSTGGPGAKAGIRPGDVITEVDGRPVRSGEELIVKTRAHRPGDRLELTLERNGEERTVSLVLGSSDGD